MVLKVFGNKFKTEVGQIYGKLVWLFGKALFLSKTVVATLWATFEKIGPLFILLSGHTPNQALSFSLKLLLQ